MSWVSLIFASFLFQSFSSHVLYLSQAALNRLIYFQHQGHSRTIISIEVKHQKNGLKQQLTCNRSWSCKCIPFVFELARQWPVSNPYLDVLALSLLSMFPKHHLKVWNNHIGNQWVMGTKNLWTQKTKMRVDNYFNAGRL